MTRLITLRGHKLKYLFSFPMYKLGLRTTRDRQQLNVGHSLT